MYERQEWKTSGEWEIGCTAPGCARRSQSGVEALCDEHSEALRSRLARRLEVLHSVAQKLYIGRSYLPERRLLEHRISTRKLSMLTPLYWSASRPEVDELERFCIQQATGRWKKVEQLDSKSERSGTWVGSWYAVYVAWSPIRNDLDAIRNDPRFSVRPVASLSPQRRLLPTQDIWFEGSGLSTLLAPSESGAQVLKEQWESLKKTSSRTKAKRAKGTRKHSKRRGERVSENIAPR